MRHALAKTRAAYRTIICQRDGTPGSDKQQRHGDARGVHAEPIGATRDTPAIAGDNFRRRRGRFGVLCIGLESMIVADSASAMAAPLHHQSIDEALLTRPSISRANGCSRWTSQAPRSMPWHEQNRPHRRLRNHPSENHAARAVPRLAAAAENTGAGDAQQSSSLALKSSIHLTCSNSAMNHRARSLASERADAIAGANEPWRTKPSGAATAAGCGCVARGQSNYGDRFGVRRPRFGGARGRYSPSHFGLPCWLQDANPYRRGLRQRAAQHAAESLGIVLWFSADGSMIMCSAWIARVIGHV